MDRDDWQQKRQQEEELTQRLEGALRHAASLGLPRDEIEVLAYGCGLKAPDLNRGEVK